MLARSEFLKAKKASASKKGMIQEGEPKARPETGQASVYRAIVIGVNSYDASSDTLPLPILKCAVNDAQEFGAALRKNGWEVVMLDEKEATKEKFTETLRNMKDKMQPEDVFLLYFSGHGVPYDINKVFFALPKTTGPADGLSQDYLEREFRDMTADQIVAIYDACRTMEKSSKPLPKFQPEALPALAETHGHTSGNKRWIEILSCQGDEFSHEYAEKQHGYFTYYLVQGLLGYADSNSDGQVTVKEICAYVGDQVRMAADRDGKKQSPAIKPVSTWQEKDYALPLATRFELPPGNGWLGESLPQGMRAVPEKYGVYEWQPPNAPQRKIAMVYVSEGAFKMGSVEKKPDIDEQPPVNVDMSGYYIAKYEVTNEEFCAFLNAVQTTHDAQGNPYLVWEAKPKIILDSQGVYNSESNKERHPVVAVTWCGAMAFAKWAGAMLPSEAQWEKAARGGLDIRPGCKNSAPTRKYPWGDLSPVGKCHFNDTLTTRVGDFPKGNSDYQVCDMAGNVWEWTREIGRASCRERV
jgi:formylglycine-generating enzyme required for sulfatase activity